MIIDIIGTTSQAAVITKSTSTDITPATSPTSPIESQNITPNQLFESTTLMNENSGNNIFPEKNNKDTKRKVSPCQPSAHRGLAKVAASARNGQLRAEPRRTHGCNKIHFF